MPSNRSERSASSGLSLQKIAVFAPLPAAAKPDATTAPPTLYVHFQGGRYCSRARPGQSPLHHSFFPFLSARRPARLLLSFSGRGLGTSPHFSQAEREESVCTQTKMRRNSFQWYKHSIAAGKMQAYLRICHDERTRSSGCKANWNGIERRKHRGRLQTGRITLLAFVRRVRYNGGDRRETK